MHMLYYDWLCCRISYNKFSSVCFNFLLLHFSCATSHCSNRWQWLCINYIPILSNSNRAFLILSICSVFFSILSHIHFSGICFLNIPKLSFSHGIRAFNGSAFHSICTINDFNRICTIFNQTPLFLLLNMENVKSVKLDDSNYIVWKH